MTVPEAAVESAALWHDSAADLTVAIHSNGHLVDVTPVALALLEAVASGS